MDSHMVKNRKAEGQQCIVSLHCGETASEHAETIAAWWVGTDEELITVTHTLDQLLDEPESDNDAQFTILFVPTNPKNSLVPHDIRMTALDAMQNNI